jgi:hypothetical protein
MLELEHDVTKDKLNALVIVKSVLVVESSRKDNQFDFMKAWV